MKYSKKNEKYALKDACISKPVLVKEQRDVYVA